MIKVFRYRLLWLAIGTMLISGILFRDQIRRIFSRQKTVAGVVAELRIKRGNEFLKSYPDLPHIKRVLLVAIKSSRQLEVWTQNNPDDLFLYRKAYAFTGFSGVAGPKRQSGDRQIPEGVYALAGLNPNSRQHLSVKIGYPNNLDQEFARIEKRTQLGGDIFIHGNNTSIGCIPIGNKNIEELFFVLAHLPPGAANIIIMPVDFRRKRHRNYTGKSRYEKRIYRLIRQEIRMKIPALNLSAAFFAQGEKKTTF